MLLITDIDISITRGKIPGVAKKYARRNYLKTSQPIQATVVYTYAANMFYKFY